MQSQKKVRSAAKPSVGLQRGAFLTSRLMWAQALNGTASICLASRMASAITLSEQMETKPAESSS